MPKSVDGKYEKILRASIEVISEKGLDKASVSDIVKKAGVAQGTFYLYFSSKIALIPAIADSLFTETLERVKGRIREDQDFWDVIKVIIDETFIITSEHTDVIVLCYSGLAFDHSMEKWNSIYKPYYNWLEDIIIKAIEDGAVTPDINIKLMARTIINLIENSAERFYISREQEENLEVFKDETFNFIKRSLVKK